MVKIIQLGAIPEEKEYKASCGYCKTIFSFLRKEACYQRDQRDGDYLSIPCPLCTREVTAALRRD